MQHTTSKRKKRTGPEISSPAELISAHLKEIEVITKQLNELRVSIGKQLTAVLEALGERRGRAGAMQTIAKWLKDNGLPFSRTTAYNYISAANASAVKAGKVVRK